MLAVPDAYAQNTLPGWSSLGHFDGRVSYVAFWMPDGAPGANVRSKPFFMCDNCIGKTLTPRSKTLVSVTLLPSDDYTGDPDLPIRNQFEQSHWEQAHPPALMKPVPAAEVTSLLTGRTAVVADVGDIIQLPMVSYHYLFGRAGCDGQRCLAHYFFRSPAAVYPPYRLDNGPFAIHDLGFRAFVVTVYQSPDTTERTAEMLTRFVQSWFVPDPAPHDQPPFGK